MAVPSLFSILLDNKVTAETDKADLSGHGKPLMAPLRRRNVTAKSAAGNTATIQFHIDPRAVDVSKRKLNTLFLYAENIHKIQAKEIRAVGVRAMHMVKQRMKHGKSLHGGRFARLSKVNTARNLFGGAGGTELVRQEKAKNSYVARKQERIAAGTNAIPTGSFAPPRSNLFAKGNLVHSMQVRVNGKLPVTSIAQSKTHKSSAPGIKIGFRGARQQDKAAWLHGGTPNMPSRPFLGLTRGEQDILTKSFVRSVRTGLDKEILRIRAMK